MSFKDPDSVNFDFDPPLAPTPDEQSAAEAALLGVGDGRAVQGQEDPDLAAEQSQGLAMIPNSMSGVFTGELPLPMARALEDAQASVVRRAAAYAADDLAAVPEGWDDPECWRVTGTASTGQIVFDHCKTTDPEDSRNYITVNGTFDRAGGRVFWNATFFMHLVEPVEGAGTMTMTASDHLWGDITFDGIDQTIIGRARSDIVVSASVAGRSMRGAVTYNADLDLQYTNDPSFCVDGGTLTLKRIWSEVPNGAEGEPEFDNAGVQFTWLGCGSVNVSWGTLR